MRVDFKVAIVVGPLLLKKANSFPWKCVNEMLFERVASYIDARGYSGRLVASHTLIVWSTLALTMVRPSGL